MSNKNNYQHHFVGDSIDEYVISPTNKIICNFIGDLFHIIDEYNLLVIYILPMAFHVLFFNYLELFE
jgi:hypothetical protein